MLLTRTTKFQWAASACVLAVSMSVTPLKQAGAETVTTTADESLKSWTVSEWLAGSDYRDLWSTPIQVEVLDLQSFAGGLSPNLRVGGQQTIGLAMTGNDGKSYTFRGILKDLSPVLPLDFREYWIDKVVQDQLAAAHPAGPLVVPVLAEAAGVLHTKPKLVVMPDDPALGEFREVFAGRLGTIEEYPTPASEGYSGFHSATEIVSTDDLWEKLVNGPEDQVDLEAFLRARLFDHLIGDWDRHARQWRWGRFPGNPDWQPIPEDRDQAFASYEGVVLGLFRPYQPKFVRFEEKYPTLNGLSIQGWQVHRWLLAGLDRSAWERIAADLQTSITDEVIDTAVRQMPQTYYEKRGEELARKLRSRRDLLAEYALRMYKFQSSEVDVKATDEDERINLRTFDDGSLEVIVASIDDPSKVYFQRKFHKNETRAVRVYLGRGQDDVVCDGRIGRRIKIEFIGDPGADEFIKCGDRARFTSIDEWKERQSPMREGPLQSKYFAKRKEKKGDKPEWSRRRDWGSKTVPVYQVGLSSDQGLLLGGGFSMNRYQFGKLPYGYRHSLTAAYSSALSTGRVVYKGSHQFWDRRALGTVNAYVSGLEQARFYGFGNETTDDEDGDFYKTNITAYVLEPELRYILTDQLDAFFSVQLRSTETDDDADTLLNQEQPYGSGNFDQLSLRGGLDYDTRDRSKVYGPGVHFYLKGVLAPSAGDVVSSFGSIEAKLSGFVDLGDRLSLNARLAGKNVFGTAPFQEAAYIGGNTSLRGYFEDRFSGESSLYGNLELRYSLGYASALFFRGEWGLFVFGDAGRVWVDGEDSDKIHTAGGGGVSVSTLERALLMTLSVAKSEERTTFFFLSNFSF